MGQLPSQWPFSLILSYLFVFILLLLLVGLFGSNVGRIVVRMQHIGLLGDIGCHSNIIFLLPLATNYISLVALSNKLYFSSCHDRQFIFYL